jgi:hypothetical protein
MKTSKAALWSETQSVQFPFRSGIVHGNGHEGGRRDAIWREEALQDVSRGLACGRGAARAVGES